MVVQKSLAVRGGTFLRNPRLLFTYFFLEESNMKKLGFAIAALSAIALAAPSVANAETVIVKRGHPHWHHSRADVVDHRGWHPHPHRDRTVIIKRGHGHRW
jgi:hypothetical protein